MKTRMQVRSLLICCLALSARAQTSAPPMTTLRAGSRIVAVDVVVADSKGNPIHRLKPSDFVLLESGKPQPGIHVDEHSSLVPTLLAPAPRLEPGSFTNRTVAPPDSAINVLLLDALNTPLLDQKFVRQEMLKYLETAHPNTRIAIFGLTAQLRMLQGFTSDPDLLRNALTDRRGSPTSSPIVDYQPGDVFGGPAAAQLSANAKAFAQESAEFQSSLRTGITLEALNVLGRYLSGLPGRKNLIWFSGSFPINILPNGALPYQFSSDSTYENEFRNAVNVLSRSQVAVYPVDARGLRSQGSLPGAGQTVSLSGPAVLPQANSDQTTMLEMAEDTGGVASINTNDLQQAVTDAIQAGSNFYTVTYTPANVDWNGRYRSIQIKVARKNVRLAYRRGYYAFDPDSPPGRGVPRISGTAPVTDFDPMRLAMFWGGPDPTEILFTAAIKPLSTGPEDTLATGNLPEPRTGGPFHRFSLNLHIDLQGTSAPMTAYGTRHLDLDLRTFVYDRTGTLVNKIATRVTADIPPLRYAAMLASGFSSRQEVSVPVKGEYFLRIGVHDLASDHVGALEVPVAALPNLTPVTPQPTTP